jgi:hypothetical protein
MDNCGNVEHPETCLCDVRLLGVQVDPDAITGMWMGKRIAEVRDYDLTDPKHIVEWLSDLVSFHDEFKTSHVPEIEDIPMLGRDPNPACYWKQIRDTVTMMVANYPVGSVLVALDHIGVSLDDFIVAMTVNKLNREITRDEYTAFEVDMLEPEPNYAAIGNKHNLGRSTVGKFRALLEPMAIRKNGAGSNPKLVKRDLHNMAMSSMTADEIIAVMQERYNATYTRDAIYNYRSYHKKRLS